MEKIRVTLDFREHKGHERIFAVCKYHAEINEILKKLPGAKFSATFKSWHLPPVKEWVLLLKEKIESIAVLDVTDLRRKLSDKKQLPSLVAVHTAKPDLHYLSANNREALQ
ncbi:MAG: hypothetical protein ACR2KZ_02585 [Segetibacter sp.]